jgi:hypothetical protein
MLIFIGLAFGHSPASQMIHSSGMFTQLPGTIIMSLSLLLATHEMFIRPLVLNPNLGVSTIDSPENGPLSCKLIFKIKLWGMTFIDFSVILISF